MKKFLSLFIVVVFVLTMSVAAISCKKSADSTDSITTTVTTDDIQTDNGASGDNDASGDFDVDSSN